MSSFDPPLSRFSAALLVVSAIMVFAWVLYAAHAASMKKNTYSTDESRGHVSPVVDMDVRP